MERPKNLAMSSKEVLNSKDGFGGLPSCVRKTMRTEQQVQILKTYFQAQQTELQTGIPCEKSKYHTHISIRVKEANSVPFIHVRADAYVHL